MLCLVVGCSGSPSAPDGGASGDAPWPIDATPDPDPMGDLLGPGFLIDSLAITGGAQAFVQLGNLALNGQLAMAIANGDLMIAIQLEDLDDPAAQADPAIRVRLRAATDSDGDPTDNFDPADPEPIYVSTATASPSAPGAITAGTLSAELGQPIVIGGLALDDVALTGRVAANASGTGFVALSDMAASGAVGVRGLGAISLPPGSPCPGSDLLAVLVNGCLIVAGSQPDTDSDGDGLERFTDTDHDGTIDRCVDGDGTAITGADCEQNARFADGYGMVLSGHATVVVLYETP